MSLIFYLVPFLHVYLFTPSRLSDCILFHFLLLHSLFSWLKYFLFFQLLLIKGRVHDSNAVHVFLSNSANTSSWSANCLVSVCTVKSPVSGHLLAATVATVC